VNPDQPSPPPFSHSLCARGRPRLALALVPAGMSFGTTLVLAGMSFRTTLVLASLSFATTPAAATSPPAQGPVYHCGSLYSQAPCAGAVPLDVADPRSEEERRQGADVAVREKRLAATLEADRHRREQPPAARGPGEPRNASAGHDGASASASARGHTGKSAGPAASKASQPWTARAPAPPKAARDTH